MTAQRRVGILIFDDVEVLDFAGPFEVFGVAARNAEVKPFDVFAIAEKEGPVVARNGLTVLPRFHFGDAPPLDVLVVPGGWGTRRELHNGPLVDWIRRQHETTELTLSVCSGALLLGAAGLLEGAPATTHYGAYHELRALVPTAEVREQVRFVETGKIVTSAGISAGIDMSLHVVSLLLGMDVAQETARYMEYHWHP